MSRYLKIPVVVLAFGLILSAPVYADEIKTEKAASNTVTATRLAESDSSATTITATVPDVSATAAATTNHDTTEAATNGSDSSTTTDTTIVPDRSYRGRLPLQDVSRSFDHDKTQVGRLLRYSFGLIGCRYRYGGTTPTKGFDCSGFVRYVFKDINIDLPHSSRSQAGLGVHVDKTDLRPGDLVFFKTGGSSRINHVGIYITDKYFIHASTSKGIVITSLEDPYYLSSYTGARRILKDQTE